MTELQEQPKTAETEKIPTLKIGFIGSDASVLGTNLLRYVEVVRLVPLHAPSYREFERNLKRLRRDANLNIPKVVIASTIGPKAAEDLNNQGISIIIISENQQKDFSFLTSDNPRRKVRNAVIAVEPIDSKSMETLLPKVAETIENLTPFK